MIPAYERMTKLPDYWLSKVRLRLDRFVDEVVVDYLESIHVDKREDN